MNVCDFSPWIAIRFLCLLVPSDCTFSLDLHIVLSIHTLQSYVNEVTNGNSRAGKSKLCKSRRRIAIQVNEYCKSMGRIAIRGNEFCKSRKRIAIRGSELYSSLYNDLLQSAFFFLIPMSLRGFCSNYSLMNHRWCENFSQLLLCRDGKMLKAYMDSKCLKYASAPLN